MFVNAVTHRKFTYFYIELMNCKDPMSTTNTSSMYKMCVACKITTAQGH